MVLVVGGWGVEWEEGLFFFLSLFSLTISLFLSGSPLVLSPWLCMHLFSALIWSALTFLPSYLEAPNLPPKHLYLFIYLFKLSPEWPSPSQAWKRHDVPSWAGMWGDTLHAVLSVKKPWDDSAGRLRASEITDWRVWPVPCGGDGQVVNFKTPSALCVSARVCVPSHSPQRRHVQKMKMILVKSACVDHFSFCGRCHSVRWLHCTPHFPEDGVMTSKGNLMGNKICTVRVPC